MRVGPYGSSGPAARPSISLRTMSTLALLGGGRMGEALVHGLLDAGWEPDALVVAEVDAERRRTLEERFPGTRVVPSPARWSSPAEAPRPTTWR